MIISEGNLSKNQLIGLVAVVTGAGRGIGYEAARSLAWLGVDIIIAEIDSNSGQKAQKKIQSEFVNRKILFFQTDIGNEKSVERLKTFAEKNFLKVDIVINNATITPIGSVIDIELEEWDESYRVNLRGPVLLAKAFLPEMILRGNGTFINVSSVGQAYMGAYESFKAAQVQLADTLNAEVSESGIRVFTISPGLVRTPGATKSIKKLAPLYGKTEEEFFLMSKEHLISCEEAGAGFAAAVVSADKYNGQEIGCRQALNDAGINSVTKLKHKEKTILSDDELIKVRKKISIITETFLEQSNGWKERPFFERQWLQRDLRKNTGMTEDRWIDALRKFQAELLEAELDISSLNIPPLQKLADYYKHMQDLAKGYEKDQDKLEKNLKIMQEWQSDINKVLGIIRK